ncbi:MAG: hypothetical protein C4527_27350 [Candidatus Omnitrophota bacterium]|jgi:hypothetical protein|nr:MAG: hypothetical protein C4527_27350 [Candidatus Omnitrophota bacterium]
MLPLPFDRELVTPESLLEWIEELNVKLDIVELDRYASRPLVFSEYRFDPPTIIIYRYLPMEDWLNLISQQYVGYYGPWYFLHIAQRLYDHLELNGLYEIERKWYHRFFGRLASIEERSHRFAQQFLGTLFSPTRFDEVVERSFRPQPGPPAKS